MCLAIASKGKRVPADYIKEAYSRNRDGAGFVYCHDGEIVVEKGFFSVESLQEAYDKMPENVPHLLHFRLATAGKENADNCHPFLISKHLAFIHNGIISDMRTCAEFSDTHYFNEDYLKPLLAKRYALIREDAFRAILSSFIGDYNKLAFLNKDGEIFIVNEDAGHWDETDEIWYSNRSYMGYTCVNPSKNFYSHGPHNINPNNSAIVKYYDKTKQTFDEWVESQLDDYLTINEYTGGIWQ